jgi:hypothetical protein
MNEQPKTELVEDVLAAFGDFGFCVRWRYSSHWADVEVFKYIGKEMSDPPRLFFNRKDWVAGPDPVYSMDEAEVYLEGYIKWDGCCELDMGCPHWCGPEDFKQHFRLLEWIYKRSRELLEAGREYGWDD